MPTTFPASKQTFTDPVGATAMPSAATLHSVAHTTINDTIEAVEDALLPSVNAQVGTTYTFVITDAFKPVVCTNASAVTVTVPLNSSVAFAIGTVLELWQGGAGAVSLAAAVGVTILRGTSLSLQLKEQHAGCTLRKTGTNEWRLIGAMA